MKGVERSAREVDSGVVGSSTLEAQREEGAGHESDTGDAGWSGSERTLWPCNSNGILEK